MAHRPPPVLNEYGYDPKAYYNDNYGKTRKVATANRMYRAEFQRKAIMRKLPDVFTIDDLQEVMQEVGFNNSQYREPVEVEVTQAVARNYARELKYKGLIVCKFNGPHPGTWRKV